MIRVSWHGMQKVLVAAALAFLCVCSVPTKQRAWGIPNRAKGHTQVTIDAKLLDGFVGRYQLGPQILTVTHANDHLTLASPDSGPALELFPESGNNFFAKTAPVEISFQTDAQGKATELLVHQDGHDLTARRIIEISGEALKTRAAQIDAMVTARYEKAPIGSITVGVVRAKDLVWSKSYGEADMENKLPADANTVYRIGSITKMFTAVMLEQLADGGKVHLSDPVEKYLPEVKTMQGRFADAPPITLMQLATHTSGLGREPDDTAKYLKGPVADWEKTLIAALPHTHYVFEPGTRFFYSNIGYATLGASLSRAAGQSYTEYLPQHIFGPLGMTHTTLETNSAMIPHLSKGYDVKGTKYDAAASQRELRGRGYKVPNGAIFTTLGDLARFVSFLLGQGPETVLKTSSLQRYQNQLEVTADAGLADGYGIGYMLMRRDNYVAFGHDGAVAGYQAALYLNRDAGVAVIVLANALGDESVDTESIALSALDILSK